jgi:hypothetical protein
MRNGYSFKDAATELREDYEALLREDPEYEDYLASRDAEIHEHKLNSEKDPNDMSGEELIEVLGLANTCSQECTKCDKSCPFAGRFYVEDKVN